MQRSSESVGALAAPLAKAQAEIANPGKSLTSTIVSLFRREGGRTFRMRLCPPVWTLSGSAWVSTRSAAA
jgi:hypothetical protein